MGGGGGRNEEKEVNSAAGSDWNSIIYLAHQSDLILLAGGGGGVSTEHLSASIGAFFFFPLFGRSWKNQNINFLRTCFLEVLRILMFQVDPTMGKACSIR